VLPLDGPPKRRVQKSGASPLPSHKFKTGDVVILPAISRNVPDGTYQVTKRLADIRPLDCNSRFGPTTDLGPADRLQNVRDTR
jgi:hypothetical protein